MSAAAPAGSPAVDPRVLEPLLRRLLTGAEAGPLRLERIGGGQSNPTFFLGFGEAPARWVLRKPPAATGLSPGAHAVDREVRVLRALEGSTVPVPRVLHFEADAGLVGTPFYVMERLHGRILPWLRSPGPTPDERREMVLQMADALGALHALDWGALGLADYGRAGAYFPRQLERLDRQWQALAGTVADDAGTVLRWLGAHLPVESPTTLIHGDFRLGNLIFQPDSPRIAGVLDWELSTLGDPLSDLAYVLLAWHLPPGVFDGVCGPDRATLGIPDEAEVRARYYAAAPPGTPPLAPFHLVFTLFRGAVMARGIVARAEAGLAVGREAAAFSALVPVFLRRAREIAGV